MKNYGVLRGAAVAYKRDDDQDPHSELLVSADGVSYRVAINVRSSRGPVRKRLIEYLMVHDLHHPIVERLASLPEGWNEITGTAAESPAIDYIRGNFFRPQDMRPIAHARPGPDNDLFERVEDLLQRAIDDGGASVYAFGERWGPETGRKDAYFYFRPGNGVHLIHMNQGGAGDSGGRWRDGALLVRFPGSAITTALFLKFQNQMWHTAGPRALPIEGAPAVAEIPIPADGEIRTWTPVAEDSPCHLARIVAAMVNPSGADRGSETVTILNTTSAPLELVGWKLLDGRDRAEDLAGSVAPGEAITVRLGGGGARFSNEGGTITLLDPRGLKVDGVAYTREDGRPDGRPVIFA